MLTRESGRKEILKKVRARDRVTKFTDCSTLLFASMVSDVAMQLGSQVYKLVFTVSFVDRARAYLEDTADLSTVDSAINLNRGLFHVARKIVVSLIKVINRFSGPRVFFIFFIFNRI